MVDSQIGMHGQSVALLVAMVKDHELVLVPILNLPLEDKTALEILNESRPATLDHVQVTQNCSQSACDN